MTDPLISKNLFNEKNMHIQMIPHSHQPHFGINLSKQRKSGKRLFMMLSMLSLAFIACKSDKNQDSSSAIHPNTNNLAEVSHVVGIGKVEPQNGIVQLAGEVSGIIQQVYKMDGDHVNKGEIIIQLSNNEQQLKVRQIEKQIKAAQISVKADQANVDEAIIKLQHKKDQLATSRKLLSSGGETNDNILQMETDKNVLESQLTHNKAIVDQGMTNIEELQSQLSIVKADLEKRSIKAPSSGTILTMNVHKGEALNALATFASFAPDEPLVVHGEADEMFANKLKIGLKVTIHNIGDNSQVATGKIIALASGLNNKSLFSDEPGEQQDRRVRRFKVLLDEPHSLLINTKVSCDIQLK